MCGIGGIIALDNKAIPDGAIIRRMTKAMAHRGPDAEGICEEGGLALGHLRLSIIDLSAAANQPFVDRSGRYLMVFNGEIYNFKEVRARITGYDFQTTGDTEVLIAAFAQWGPDCLRYLRGMFAFAIWDREKKELFMARDPMGVKPLYYYLDDRWLIFASEIRAIVASGLVPPRLSNRALIEYFSYQSVGYPLSPVEGVLQLEAGTWMKIGHGQTEKRAYWDVTGTAVDFDFSDKAAVQKRIRYLLLQSIERRMVSDVPVGAFLSGGIDSSAVVGLMAEAGGAAPNTFTVAFEEKQYDESEYAAIIARKFNTRHTRILLKPSVFLDELQNGLDAMDCPSGDGINTYVVSKAIRRNGMTVALSGAGGDELFAGYPFFGQFLSLRERPWLWKIPGSLRRLAALGWTTANQQGKKGRMAQLLGLPDASIEKVYPIFRQLLSPAGIRELTNLSGNGNTVTAVESELIARRNNIAAFPLLSQVSIAEYLGYTQHTLLKDTDQMSMAVSLEVREPFFDQDLVEFILNVPDALKRPSYPKSLLVESISPLLPDEIVHRRKQGFLLPWDIWLRNDLKGFCEGYLAKIAQRPFVNADNLFQWWNRFLSGDKNVRWSEIWLFVVLEYWLEKNGVS